MKRKYLFFAALILAVLACIGAPSVIHAQEPLILGFPSFLSATELHKRFGPLAEHLGRELGRPVKILNEGDYEAHMYRIKKGKVDIAFLGPAAYIAYTKKFGKVPLLAVYETDGKKTFRGFIVVNKASTITKLSQLRGKNFAFGDAKSTMGHILPRYIMMRSGIEVKHLGRHEFLGNHENIALGVLSGKFDAGAVREDIYNTYSKEGLNVLAISEPMPDHLFVARPGLQYKTVSKVTKILVSLKDTEDGRKILRSMQKNLTALIAGSDKDYDSLREIIDYLAKAGVKL
ncbi:MAG: phosphate/phosphite/phosphonate ABC transporter substrate-binding protein [Nitrospirae bacterium]|nr:phosphate/phosphite/phosphonate ABC transporter substrate-binding protein [Nitrospirota bacterium]